MKKSFILKTVIIGGLFMFAGSTLFAQSQQTVPPLAGLTPESPFYFFDRLGEYLQRFFTFSPEGKARLEIAFAAERVAEIKVILESKGVQAKGIKLAQNLLNDEIARSAAILVRQKDKGKNIDALAKELSGEFAGTKTALEQTFKDKKRVLDNKKDELKAKIHEAQLSGDITLVELLTKQLNELNVQKELLKQGEDEQEQDLDEQEESIDKQMSAKDEAEKNIKKAEKERAEIVNEAKKQGLDIPAETFIQFDSILSQAKIAIEGGKYDEARQLAKQAKKSIEEIDDNIENLKDAKENEQELKEEVEDEQEEAEEKLKEADKESAEMIKEELEQKKEKLKEYQEKAKEEVKHAKEQLQKPKPKLDE
jgi:hypothetical protein